MTKALVLPTLGRMFNLGPMELILIGAAALLVFGPRRLPELAKGLGKGIRDFKKALDGHDDEEKTKEAGLSTKENAETLPPGGTVPKQTTSDTTKTKVGAGDDGSSHG